MKMITKSKYTIITSLMTLILFMMVSIPSYTYATIDPNDYKPGSLSYTDVSKVKKAANPIIGTIKTLGVVVAVITLAIIGIKYMIGSTAEKAEYKKTMIPYLIGAIMVVAITQFLSVLIKIITNIK